MTDALVVEPGKTRIGWIGTGVMGVSMCRHIMSAGYAATIFSRTKSKADTLIADGAVWVDTPKAVAQNSDVVFTIVGYPADVREVILGDEGVLRGCSPGNVIVDMTTSQPKLAVEIYERAKELGVQSIDAPVSGGDVGAQNAALSIMIGGESDVVDSLNLLWELSLIHI